MPSYTINKGVGKSPEFKGLRAQYLFYMAGGLMGAFLLFTFMYIIGIHMYLCIGVALLLVGLLLHYVFSVNKKYGQYGLMKLAARNKRPRYIIARQRVKV